MYNNFEIVFDPAKNIRNIVKHNGVSLANAADLEWETSLVWRDLRYDYQEHRMCGIGYIGHRLFHVVFVDRGVERRIISLRKANQREEKRYAEA
jgi:uncharacterized DUF497 family protein